MVRLEPLLRAAREQIGAAKDAWLKFTSGRAENLPRLKQTMAAVHGQAAEIGNAALTRLTASLAARLDRDAGAATCPKRSRWSTRPACCSPKTPSTTTPA